MELRAISLRYDREDMETLLRRAGIRQEKGLEYACGLYKGETLLACGGYEGGVIKCLAVDPARQGEALLNTIVSHLYTRLIRSGIREAFVFTKPENTTLFQSLGFFPLAQADQAVLLTSRREGVAEYVAACQRRAAEAGLHAAEEGAAAIVMNANPFTLGHRCLVEHAAQGARLLHIFVVEEERSAFPFSARLRLVQEGVKDIPQALVHPGGRYIISAATFPSYFLKDPGGAAPAHAELDARLFAHMLAPALHIKMRLVGEEPLDPLTRLYNKALGRILPDAGVALCVIPRKESGGAPISASRVRALHAVGRLEEARALLPEATYRYLAELGKP